MKTLHFTLYLHAETDALWSGQRDSNSRHQAWEACTLPTELCPLIIVAKLRQNYEIVNIFRNFDIAIAEPVQGTGVFTDV
jgi:hypothetical protein